LRQRPRGAQRIAAVQAADRELLELVTGSGHERALARSPPMKRTSAPAPQRVCDCQRRNDVPSGPPAAIAILGGALILDRFAFRRVVPRTLRRCAAPPPATFSSSPIE